MIGPYVSWGRYPFQTQAGEDLQWIDELSPWFNGCVLAQGNARSYGDSCMNAKGKVVSTRLLRRFIGFNSDTGRITCESGVQLADILNLIEPQGWFLEVTPGTRYVTVGGAIANDVHGKNHHVAGSFGHHVIRFELVRTDGSRMICSETQNPEWFYATIGGLGLTGLITWVEIQLKKVSNSALNVETIKYGSLDEFYQLSYESEADYEYTVAWVDCLAAGEKLGRGHFMRANHAAVTQHKPNYSASQLAIPVELPLSLVNKLSLRLFNQAYYHRQQQKRHFDTVHFAPFFYPLDGIGYWNRMYGPKGFLQYQFVVPPAHAKEATREVLERISVSGMGSFLAVLKLFGDIQSKGLLSFPRLGTTLALDFPFQGNKTLALLRQLDEIVVQAGGAIYPAKDACIQPRYFKTFYPNIDEFLAFKDPQINSSFWNRVMGDQL